MKSIDELLSESKYDNVARMVSQGRLSIDYLSKYVDNKDFDAIRVMIHYSLYRPGLHSKLKPIGVYLADEVARCNSTVIAAATTYAVHHETQVTEPVIRHRRYNSGLQILLAGIKRSQNAAQIVVSLLADPEWDPSMYDAVYQVAQYLRNNTDQIDLKLQFDYQL